MKGEPPAPRQRTDVAIVLAELGNGGVGKGRVHLANELARRGYRVDLVLNTLDGPYRSLVGDGVRVHKLHTTHALTGVPQFVHYLRRYRPRAVLAQRIRVHTLAERARRIAGVDTRLAVTVNTQLSRHFANMARAKADRQAARLQRYFPRADRVLAVSEGVAADVREQLGWPAHAVPVVPNPAIEQQIHEHKHRRVDHAWFAPDEPPVVLAVGRLTPQKDFPTLLRAFSGLRAHIGARLVILGEGRERVALLEQASALGIDDAVDLPGFVTNPYPWMDRASMLVVSSAWEGFGNVLVEALALGTPVAATDCPSGPREILQDGRYGPLVPVGDDRTLADAMANVLSAPLPRPTLQTAAAPYDVAASADRYLAELGLTS